MASEDRVQVGKRIVVTEEVVGYYVKGCGAQISVAVMQRLQGLILRVRKIEIEVDFDRMPFPVWVPKDKVKVL